MLVSMPMVLSSGDMNLHELQRTTALLAPSLAAACEWIILSISPF
jgi:hypothetical protein